MACTLAMLAALAVYNPPKGTVVTIPRSSLSEYTPKQIARGRKCCQSWGIVCQIDESK